MSVLSERPPIPTDTSHPILTPAADSPIAIPDVVVNGRKQTNSASLPHRRPKSSASNRSGSANDEWGSNFWVTLVDPQTNTQFYACPATGQVSWDPPIGSFLLPPSEEGEWWELTDEARGGIPYYYQTKTGETVWERPDAFVIPLGILQNTSLARRLSARYNISAQNDGSLPTTQEREDRRRNRLSTSSERPANRKTRSPHLPLNDGSPEPRDPKRRSQSSTQSSGGRITPSNGSPVPKKSRHVVRRSFSSDQYGGFSQHVNHLPTIPASDASSVLSATASPRRKSTSTLRSVSYDKDSPPKNGTGGTKSKNKAYSTYRSPQPQSLNAAVELLSLPQKPSASKPVRDNANRKLDPSEKKQSPGHLSIPPKPAHLRPSQSVPTTPTQPVRGASAPVVLHGKEISAPVLNRDAAMNMGPAKERANAQPILVEREAKPKIPTERTNATGMPILPQDLRSDIQQFVESDFAKQYFSTHRTGFIFRRTIPVTEMMSWQKAPLNAPLLSLNKDLHKNAVRAFKVIQRIMGDRERERTATRSDSLGSGSGNLNGSTSSLVSSLGVFEEERWLLSEVLTHGELRDEVYCQVVKQLIGNPSTESVFKGWQLLCVFLVTFPPSKNFETYLRSFISQRTTHSEGRVDVMAKYCLRRLAFISKKGPRGKAPTTAEIETASDAAFNPSIFGETIDIIYRLQQRTYPQQRVPIILPFLADGILALGGTKLEGIFRVPGDGDGVSDLKLRIDKGYYTLEGVDDPNVLASLMKLWLRELCDPLVPEEMYNVCVSSSKLPEACVELVKRLPTINRRVVLFVISFLQLFLDERIQATTKMTPANLALVMAPNLLRCNSDSMAVVFNNAQYEQEFVYHLLLHLRCHEVDPDYVPTHGHGAIAASNQAQPRASKSRNRR